MRIDVFIFVICIAGATSARAADPDLGTWSEGILARLPFENGSLNRERYSAHTNSFVADKKAYFESVFGNLMNKAKEHGFPSRADALRRDQERRIRELDINVDLATESIFGSLDPDGDGVIRRSEARSILQTFAAAADLDNNELLDQDEQRLAEWSLSTGKAIADKSDVYAIRRQFREMERTEGW
jgi:hypothetical protein|nr:hypothetical protein [Neorhizobium tomejilense]